MAYDWPGNIRELENIIDRSMILSHNGILEYGEWIPAEKIYEPGNGNNTASKPDDVKKEHIAEILKKQVEK